LPRIGANSERGANPDRTLAAVKRPSIPVGLTTKERSEWSEHGAQRPKSAGIAGGGMCIWTAILESDSHRRFGRVSP
jgi:hypothetical protein